MPFRGKDKGYRPARKAYRPPPSSQYNTGESRYTSQYAYKYPVANEESRYRGKVITTNYPDERQEAVATQRRIPPPATPGAAWLRGLGGQLGFNTGGRSPYFNIYNYFPGLDANRPVSPERANSWLYKMGIGAENLSSGIMGATNAGVQGALNSPYLHTFPWKYNEIPSASTGTPHNVPWGAGVAPSEHGVRKPQPKGTLSYTPPPDTGASTDTGYGGYYPYYGGGGGGGYDYSGSSYSSPFTQYQPGYAAQGSQAPAAMGMRTAPQQAPYRSNYATANQQARWLSLLTNWRI